MARKLTADQMVAPKAIAPFEAAEAFKLWSERWNQRAPEWTHDSPWSEWAAASLDGLGPPFRLEAERDNEFGERCAVALFTLIMEI